MKLFKSIKKGIKSIGRGIEGAIKDVGSFASDIVKGAGDVLEDAWDNEIVRAAAIAAGAYYFGPQILGGGAKAGAAAGATAGASSFSLSNAWTGLVDKAFIAGYSPSALGVAQWGVTSALGVAQYGATAAVKGVGKQLAVNMLTGAVTGGGKGSPMPQMARASTTGSFGPSTQYGTFKASVADIGIDARVADAMAKVAQTNNPSLRGALNQIGRVAASGPNISVGSTQISVRSDTRVS